jgi:hypothetical protein
MCCLFAVLVLLGPRAFIIIHWLLYPAAWALAFSNPIVPLLGFLFLPWTTLFYVFAYPGGLDTLDWLFIGFGVVADVMSFSGGLYGNRERAASYYRW